MLMAILFSGNLSAFAEPDNSGDRGYWQGEKKCDTLFETLIPSLPGGSYLTKILGDGKIHADYELNNGGVIRVKVRDVRKVPVNGLNFDSAYADLAMRKPLQDRLARRVESHVVLADVRTMVGSSFLMKKTTDEITDITTYRIRPQSLRLSLKANVRVADWADYALADGPSQKRWDRHQCTSYHHELGHILVAAQVLEESQTEWLDLQAPTKEDFSLLHDELMTDIQKRIQARQEAYHAALEEMGPAIGRSRPYMELKFDWLKQSPDSLEGGAASRGP